MPGPEDPLRAALDRLAAPADPAGAYERIVEKKIRRQIYRKLQVAALAVVVIAGTVGGSFVLASVFRADRDRVHPAQALAANGLIAFVSNREGNADVFVMDHDGTHVTNLTRDAANDHSPAFSPDGSRIAFVSDRDGGPDIYVMNADGTDVHRLTTLPGSDDSPSWSPAGTKIAFADNTDIAGRQVNYQLYVMNADGSDVVRLTGDLALTHGSRPAWSPDGSRIAFTSHRLVHPYSCSPFGACPLFPHLSISVAAADGSKVKPLADVGAGSSAPAWSPDGTSIAFESEGDIYVMAQDGTGVHRVTKGPAVDTAPAWSPDGRKLVFSSQADGSFGIDVVDANGSARRQLTSGVAAEAAPSWQPLLKAHPPIEPSEPPTESSSPTPEPPASPSPSPLPPECDATVVSGDFNGDGISDLATVAKTTCLLGDGPGYPFDHPYALEVRWGGGSAGTVPLPDCQEVCVGLAAVDVNHDGAAEFILQIGSGASTQFVELYELPLDAAFGQSAVTTAQPGAPGYEADKPTVFALNGSVTHQDFLTCDVNEGGKPGVIATNAVLNKSQTEWAIHETVFTFDPSLNWPNGQFQVVSTADSTSAFDPTGANQPQPSGPPCWTDGTSPSPTSVP